MTNYSHTIFSLYPPPTFFFFFFFFSFFLSFFFLLLRLLFLFSFLHCLRSFLFSTVHGRTTTLLIKKRTMHQLTSGRRRRLKRRPGSQWGGRSKGQWQTPDPEAAFGLNQLHCNIPPSPCMRAAVAFHYDAFSQTHTRQGKTGRQIKKNKRFSGDGGDNFRINVLFADWPDVPQAAGGTPAPRPPLDKCEHRTTARPTTRRAGAESPTLHSDGRSEWEKGTTKKETKRNTTTHTNVSSWAGQPSSTPREVTTSTEPREEPRRPGKKTPGN